MFRIFLPSHDRTDRNTFSTGSVFVNVKKQGFEWLTVSSFLVVFHDVVVI